MFRRTESHRDDAFSVRFGEKEESHCANAACSNLHNKRAERGPAKELYTISIPGLCCCQFSENTIMLEISGAKPTDGMLTAIFRVVISIFILLLTLVLWKKTRKL